MLVDFRFLLLGESSDFEIWHTYYQHKGWSHDKKFMAKEIFFNPWEGVKVGSSEILLIATHVGRFQITFLCKSFGLEIWHIYY